MKHYDPESPDLRNLAEPIGCWVTAGVVLGSALAGVLLYFALHWLVLTLFFS